MSQFINRQPQPRYPSDTLWLEPIECERLPVITLIPNDPLNLETLQKLLHDQDELYLVWPDAKYPFDMEQWREAILSEATNISFYVGKQDEIIGHAALRETDVPQEYAICYVFICPEHRGNGYGRDLVQQLEIDARDRLGAKTLRLHVRSYNPLAMYLYDSMGFQGYEQIGTLTKMRKRLSS